VRLISRIRPFPQLSTDDAQLSSGSRSASSPIAISRDPFLLPAVFLLKAVQQPHLV
jgi:hypothetical protein